MTSRPEARWKELSWDDESGGIGAEVGEEEGEGVEHKECHMVAATKLPISAGLPAQVVVDIGEDEHEKRHEEEATQLDDPATYNVNQGHSEPVARHRGAESDERLRTADLENLFQSAHGLLRGQPAN